jgi:hypothetical protein
MHLIPQPDRRVAPSFAITAAPCPECRKAAGNRIRKSAVFVFFRCSACCRVWWRPRRRAYD